MKSFQSHFIQGEIYSFKVWRIMVLVLNESTMHLVSRLNDDNFSEISLR